MTTTPVLLVLLIALAGALVYWSAPYVGRWLVQRLAPPPEVVTAALSYALLQDSLQRRREAGMLRNGYTFFRKTED